MRRLAALACLMLAATACGRPQPAPDAEGRMELSSPAFEDGGTIPEEFTCDGDNVSPPLEWSGAPEETGVLALVLEDPDAPDGTFTHWTVYGIDPSTTRVGRDAVPESGVQGTNDLGRAQYNGPCPPEGETHRYVFTVYALSETTGLQPDAPPPQVREAVQASELASASITASYER